MVRLKLNKWLLYGLVAALVSCKTTQPGMGRATPTTAMSQDEWRTVNKILQLGLDREALYTLVDSIKPMSSLVVRSYPIANTDSTLKASGNVVPPADEKYIDSIAYLQNALNKLNLPDLKIVAVPYKNSGGKKLLLQLSAIRISSLNKLLADKKRFFGQFGLVPGADPYLVVSTIENADKYERFRGYGYLFGYPDYAVDFFVHSAQSTEGQSRVAPRKFFNIPAYAGSKGYFVYAYPDNEKPTVAVDSILYYKAEKTLQQYRSIRNQYLEKDSSLNALKLLQTLRKK